MEKPENYNLVNKLDIKELIPDPKVRERHPNLPQLNRSSVKR